MDLSNTSAPESFTIYRNFIHFRQPARPPPVRSEQLRPCRQKPKTQRVRRPARSGGGRAQGEPRCKPERGSRKCAWAMWRCRRRTQEAEAKALRRRAVGLFAKRPGEKPSNPPRRDRPVCCGAGVRASTSGILLPKAKKPAAPGRIHATRGRNRVGEASAAGTGGAADASG